MKVTFHVFNRADGTGSWPNTPQGIMDLTNVANFNHNGYERYSVTRQANYPSFAWNPPVAQVSDSRVNYELTNIYFYNDNTLNTVMSYSPMMNHVQGVDPARLEEGLPIFFNNAPFNGYAGYATYPSANMNSPLFVHTSVVSPPMGLWFCADHLKHEIGHCMDWRHTYGSEYDCNHPDFLSDVFPTGVTGCTHPCGVCYEGEQGFHSNNMMGGGGYFNGPYWTSSLQMARRTRTLHLLNARKFVKEMESEHQYTWDITNDETWDFDIQMYHDIVVKPGATLTIKCRVGMANRGRIIVERGARLIIDGGEVYAWGSNWAGIQVWGTTAMKQKIEASGLSLDQGIVNIINDGTVADAENGITTIKYDGQGNWDWGGYTGGIIQCDGARFINNWRAIQYLSYRNFNSNNATMPNLGYVQNSLFETNAVLKEATTPNPEVFVSLWDVTGVRFLGNTYQNTRSPLPAIQDRGMGFFSIDAGYTIERYQICSQWNQNGDCVAYSVDNPSTFNNLHYGVRVENTNPLTRIIVRNNDFNAVNRSIYMQGTLFSTLTGNTIDVGPGLNSNAFLPYGIYVEGCADYQLSNNVIFTTQTNDYNFSMGTGICVNGVNSTNSLDNLVYRNQVNMMGSGSTVIGNNQGANIGDGLEFWCNKYGQGSNGQNYMDLYMAFTPSIIHNGLIDYYQGSPTSGANNFFSHTINPNSSIMTDFNDSYFTGVQGPFGSIEYFFNPESSLLTEPQYYDQSLTINALPASYEEKMCPETFSSGNQNVKRVTTNAIQAELEALTASINELNRILPPSLTAKQRGQLVDLKRERRNLVAEALRSLLDNSTDGWDAEQVIALLKAVAADENATTIAAANYANGQGRTDDLISTVGRSGMSSEEVHLRQALVKAAYMHKFDGAGSDRSAQEAQALLMTAMRSTQNEYMILPTPTMQPAAPMMIAPEPNYGAEPSVFPNPSQKCAGEHLEPKGFRTIDCECVRYHGQNHLAVRQCWHFQNLGPAFRILARRPLHGPSRAGWQAAFQPATGDRMI
ncbi:MAG: hypothetical protein U0176_23935 [Bacteroidia bacterium]